jgi:hypothetical protein
MRATNIPTVRARVATVQIAPDIAITAIAPHSMMSPTLPQGSPGTDIVWVFCARLRGTVNATNVQGVRL